MVLLITVPMKEELPVHQQRFASWTGNININKEIFLKLLISPTFAQQRSFPLLHSYIFELILPDHDLQQDYFRQR